MSSHCIREPSVRIRILQAVILMSCILCLALSNPPLASEVPSDSEEQTLQATGSKKHRKHQQRPIRLGTSGGNIKDRTQSECCDGTLGALVEKNGTQYILSNNHVLARTNKGKIGEAIIQPGRMP